MFKFDSLSLVNKQVKQNTVFCILSGFNFRVLFTNTTTQLKKRVSVIVGRCSNAGFLQPCCNVFSAY